MTSLTAGSPTCNCKNPDTCIHAFTLTVKDRTFTYKQDRFISFAEAIDEGGQGVPVSLLLQGKGCVSNNARCPQGYIMNRETGDSFKEFNNGLTTYKATYNNNVESTVLSNAGAIEFLSWYVISRDTRKVVPATKYFLRVAQCRGEPFTNKSLSFKDGMMQLFNQAPRDALWSYISIYPEFKWKAEVVIKAEQEVIEHTDKELIREQRQINREKGVAGRGQRGWSKLPRHSIKQNMSVEGSLSYSLNSMLHDYTATLNRDTLKRSDEFTLLESATKTIDTVCNALSTNKKRKDEITLLSVEFLYPEIKISGEGELKESKEREIIYLEKKVALALSPLTGMRLKLDLIQAFAAFYNSDVAAKILREGLASGKDDFESGKNSVFVDTQFFLYVEGSVDLALKFSTDEDDKWQWQAGETIEAKLALGIEAKVYAGAKYYAIEGALDLNGKAEAVVCLGLDPQEEERVDLVFYHEGIKAHVKISYYLNLVSGESRTENKKQGVPSKMNCNTNDKNTTEVEWIIHEELDKNDSKFRVNIC